MRRFLLSLLLSPCGLAAQDPEPYDLILAGGHVIDGTGNPWFRADVGIRDRRVVAVGRLAGAETERRLDVAGLAVIPGFIDVHSHADRGLASPEAERRAAPNLVAQGITTLVCNQDGRSVPIAAQIARFEQLGIGPNAISLVGHGTVRRAAMRNNFRRPATDAEIDDMRKRVREALAAGAYGMSAGLEYVPGRWSTREEIVALVSELAPVGGVYICHERSSGADPMWYLPSQDQPGPPTMLDNILELIEVSERTGVTVVATHIKAKGANFWGSSGALIHLIDRARARGVSIYADQYPYNTSGTDGRVVLIPGWVRPRGSNPAEALDAALEDDAKRADLERDIAHEIARRGGADQIVVMDHPDRSFVGKSVRELAEQHLLNPIELAIKLQLEGYRDRPGGARMRGYSMSELDVEAMGKQRWCATSTDAGIALPGDGPVHPRFYGSFPRKLRHYAMDRGLMTVEEAVRSGTSLPAQILDLRDRGQVREGFWADLAVLDLRTIRDKATAFEPHQHSDGVVHVLVGGEFVVEAGELTGALPGRVIRLKR